MIQIAIREYLKGHYKVVMVLVLLSFIGPLTDKAYGEQWSKAQQEIWNLEVTYWECIKNRDIESYGKLLHKNTLPWPSGSFFPTNKANTVARIERWLSHDKIISYDLKPLAINLFKNIAIVCYSYEWRGVRYSDMGRITHTWLNQNGIWEMIGGMNASYNSLPRHNKIE